MSRHDPLQPSAIQQHRPGVSTPEQPRIVACGGPVFIAWQALVGVHKQRVGQVALALRIPVGGPFDPPSTPNSVAVNPSTIRRHHRQVGGAWGPDNFRLQRGRPNRRVRPRPHLQRSARHNQAADGDARHAFAVFKVSGLSSNALLERSAEPCAEKLNSRRRNTRLGSASKLGCALCVRPRIKLGPHHGGRRRKLDPGRHRRGRRGHDVGLQPNQVVVFNTVQMYRHDRLAYLKAMAARALEAGHLAGVKLVRGAYMEKERSRAEEQGYPRPSSPTKPAATETSTRRWTGCWTIWTRCIWSRGATTKPATCGCVKAWHPGALTPRYTGVLRPTVGHERPHHFQLAAHGYNVAKYVPYGPIREAIPYLIRRAQENTSVAGQTLRELELLKQEQQRRKG